MSFGLANAPSVHQRAINQALRSLLISGKMLVYLNDVLIPPCTVNDNIDLMSSVLELLKKKRFSD